MVKSAVKVCVRTRPTANFASKNLIIDLDGKRIEAFIPKDNTQGFINNQLENWKFKFDEILHNASQEEVYDTCAREIVSSVVQGYNGTVLAYGQTGAGKTYTMSGGAQSYRFRGITPRAVSQLFQEISSRPEQAFSVKISFAEIYNELIYDLLSPTPPSSQTGTLMIHDDPKHGVIVKGLCQITCYNEEDALNQLFEGESNRTVAEHKLNKSSTRSHCIYTVHVESRSRVESTEKVVVSKLNLVDLAGSERTKKTGSEGLTLTEANCINKSLSYLEQVVIALSERGREHVPYRQSKLTNMLKDSIGGNSKTLMVANVWPEPEHMEETISTLRFATRMMRVTNEAIVNVEVDPGLLVERYKREIRDLKQELAMHDTLANRGRVAYEPYTPEQQFQMQQLAEAYFDGSTEEIEIESLRQVRELFVQMRNIYRRMLTRLGVTDFKHHDDAEEPRDEVAKPESKKTMVGEEGVGDEERIGGFGLGKANPKARPTDTSAIEPKTEFVQEEDPEEVKASAALEQSAESKGRAFAPAIDKNQAFMEFKNSEGREIEAALASDKKELAGKRAIVKDLTMKVNAVKREIDECKEFIDHVRNNRAEEEDVIDEEEYATIRKMKEHKKTYREAFEVLKNAKDDVSVLTQNIESNRERLLSEFESWYENRFGLKATVRSRSPKEKQPQDVSAMDDIDSDALAYIRAKKHVQTLHKAKKTLGAMGKA